MALMYLTTKVKSKSRFPNMGAVLQRNTFNVPRITAMPRGGLWTREWQPVLQVQTAFDVHCSAVPVSPSRSKILGFILVLLIWWSTVFFWSRTVNIGNEEDARWQYHIEEIIVTQRKILQASEPSRHSPGTHKLGKQQTNDNYICYSVLLNTCDAAGKCFLWPSTY